MHMALSSAFSKESRYGLRDVDISGSRFPFKIANGTKMLSYAVNNR